MLLRIEQCQTIMLGLSASCANHLTSFLPSDVLSPELTAETPKLGEQPRALT
jgi:hypothetical protein